VAARSGALARRNSNPMDGFHRRDVPSPAKHSFPPRPAWRAGARGDGGSRLFLPLAAPTAPRSIFLIGVNPKRRLTAAMVGRTRQKPANEAGESLVAPRKAEIVPSAARFTRFARSGLTLSNGPWAASLVGRSGEGYGPVAQCPEMPRASKQPVATPCSVGGF